MKVQKVVYQLFESDYEDIAARKNDDTHIIDREVRLDIDKGNSIYISWTEKPIQFSVGYQGRSWFNEPEKVIDTSNWSLWKPIIGKECELNYQDKYHQLLELKGEELSVYFSSQENGQWESDVLNISRDKPVPDYEFVECERST